GVPAPPLVEHVVAQRVLGAAGQVAGGGDGVAVAPVLLGQEADGHAGVEQGPGRPGGQAQRRPGLLEGQAGPGFVEDVENAELHGGHDDAGDPEPEEELEDVVGVGRRLRHGGYCGSPSMETRGWSLVTASPGAQRTALTTPSAGALTSSSIFMASTTTRAWPRLT